MRFHRFVVLGLGVVAGAAIAQATAPPPGAKPATPAPAAPAAPAPGATTPAAAPPAAKPAAAPASAPVSDVKSAAAATAAPAGVKSDSPCKQDIEEYCKGVEAGGGRIIKCLLELFQLQKENSVRLGYDHGIIEEPYTIYKINRDEIVQVH